MSFLSNFLLPLRCAPLGRTLVWRAFSPFVWQYKRKSSISLQKGKFTHPLWPREAQLKHFSSSSQTGHFQTTIYALSSGHGKCGVAVIRISGPCAKEALLKLGALTELPKPRSTVLRKLINPQNNVALDKALVIWFPGPNSFTGEDSCELHVHGGPAVVTAVFEALDKIPGLQYAEPGEFTRRAFANGKLDLPEVEGLADLIHAETEAQRQQALRQMDGDLSRLYTKWRGALIQCAAKVAAYIDFSEDELIEDDVLVEVKQMVEELKRDIKSHLDDKRRGERLRSGVRLAIIGEPNVGKSSIFNKLCQRPAAIVSPIAGTTRDVVENALNISGYPVVLSDTAGMHEVDDPIEVEGVRRAKERAQVADLQIIVVDASKIVLQPVKGDRTSSVSLREYLSSFGCLKDKDADSTMKPPSERDDIQGILGAEDLLISPSEYNLVKENSETTSFPLDETQNDPSGLGEVIVIFNKADLINTTLAGEHLSRYSDWSFLSCVTEEGMEHFLELLAAKVKLLCGNPSSGTPSLTQARHRACLSRCHEALVTYLRYHDTDSVLAGEQLRRAVYHMGKLTGKISSEDILDVVFRDFCIGK